ncbi:hypothetical protein NKH18_20310 [Streptomyces sp. M10(2022)]
MRLRGEGAYKSSAKSGSWLRLAAATVTVPARTRADVPFAVTVPSATPPGSTRRDRRRERGREVPVRVHLRVSGPTLAALTVEDVSVSGRTIHYTLVNRGNTTLVPRLSVGVDGMFTTLLSRAERTLELELKPGARAELTEPWSEAPPLTRSPSGCGSRPGRCPWRGIGIGCVRPLGRVGRRCAAAGPGRVRRRRVPTGKRASRAARTA